MSQVHKLFARFLIAVLTAAITLNFFPLSVNAVSARAYCLIDEASGRVIVASNADKRMPMASTTKIMTGLLAVESGKLDETITVEADVIRVEGSSMGLKADEKITLREVVYGLMLESGNDAANTIAVFVGGSMEDFVEKMNARAAKLGLKNTHFCNPSGLYNEQHYTSAGDLALLAACAMKNPEFAKIVGTKSIRVSYDGQKNGRYLLNHNKLLGVYDGAMGVKTGFTKKSGRCLVSCAKRNGIELILATLNDPDDWHDHKELLDSGFKLLTNSQILTTTENITAKVVGGKADTVAGSFEKTANAALKAGEFSRVSQHCELDRFYYAPIKKGQLLGHIVYTVDGIVVAKTDISAARDVEVQKNNKTLNFFEQMWKNITDFFYKLFH